MATHQLLWLLGGWSAFHNMTIEVIDVTGNWLARIRFLDAKEKTGKHTEQYACTACNTCTKFIAAEKCMNIVEASSNEGGSWSGGKKRYDCWFLAVRTNKCPYPPCLWLLFCSADVNQISLSWYLIPCCLSIKVGFTYALLLYCSYGAVKS